MLRRTIAERVVIEADKVKGSRFFATLAPAADRRAVARVLAEVRQQWPDATHHASAWRLGPDEAGCDDDGEVGGTAGPPILARLEGHGLEGVVAVVTRFYGGTKLGKGGLVRAYGGAASAAIEAVDIVEERVCSRVSVQCAHGLVGPLQGVAARFDGVVEVAWSHPPTVHIDVPVEAAHDLLEALVDRAAGQLDVLAAPGPVQG